MAESWYNREMFKDIPKNELLRLVAKTTHPTDHRNDVNLPPEERRIRKFPKEELMLAGRSLIQRPVLINHDGNQVKGVVLDSEPLPEMESVEAIIRVPPEIVAAYNAKKFKTCSVGYGWRELIVEGDTETAVGLWFGEISLVMGNATAGDPNASVNRFEFKVEAVKTDPLPEMVEKKVFDETVTKLAEAEKKLEESPKRIKELEEAVGRLTTTIDESKKTKAIEINNAVKEAKMELINKVDKVLPKIMIMRQSESGLNRLTQDVKKVLKEESVI